MDSWCCTVLFRVEPHCQMPWLLVHWSYRERNTHAILNKYGGVRRQMDRESSFQWLHLQVEQCFWDFFRWQVKHIPLLFWLHCRKIWEEYSELCYLLCLCLRENLLNIFIVGYKDLLTCFKFRPFNNSILLKTSSV